MPLPTTTDLTKLTRKLANPIQHYKIASLFEDEYEKIPVALRHDYIFNPETRTYSLDELSWLEWRKHGPYYYDPEDARYIPYTVGGSDVSALFDGSKLAESLFLYEGQHGSNFKCASELWADKIGMKLPLHDPKNQSVLWTGHNEEPSIRALFLHTFKEDHPLDIVNVINDSHMYQCGIRDTCGKLLYPFVLCNLDGIVEINGEKGVLECKTCQRGSEDYRLWKNGRVPLKYYLQVVWYMLCMNLPYAYICVKWGISSTDFRYFYIERNLEVEELVIEMVQDFIRSCETRTEPQIDGQNTDRLLAFYRKMSGNPKPEEEPLVLPKEFAEDIMDLSILNEKIAVLNSDVARLKKERNAILATKIFPYVDEHTEIEVPYTEKTSFKLSLHNKSMSYKHIDEEKLKAEQPELYKKYVMHTKTFDAKLFFKEQVLLAEEYMVEDDILTPAKMDYCKVTIKKMEANSDGSKVIRRKNNHGLSLRNGQYMDA